MTDFINESIIFDLKCLKNSGCDQTAVDGLIEKISGITCIHSLRELFANLEIQGTDNNLQRKITEWQAHLENVVISHQEALVQLKQIEITAQNKSLIILLQEITNCHHLLLHSKILSLLKMLGQEKLPELIHYIIALDTATQLETVLKGSFFDQKISSKQQKDCIFLLHNLASAFNDKSPFWNDANALLQSALLIYPALAMPKDEQPGNSWSCTLI